MDLQLDGKVAVVTGASKGIGLAIVKTLVAEGVTVVAGARSPGALSQLGLLGLVYAYRHPALRTSITPTREDR